MIWLYVGCLTLCQYLWWGGFDSNGLYCHSSVVFKFMNTLSCLKKKKKTFPLSEDMVGEIGMQVLCMEAMEKFYRK